jgi:hypothetical protein
VSIDKITEELACFSESADCFRCEKLEYAEMEFGRERRESVGGHGRRDEIRRVA